MSGLHWFEIWLRLTHFLAGDKMDNRLSGRMIVDPHVEEEGS